VTALGFALVTFICSLGCALLGTYVRELLPPAHLSKESQDVIRLGMGLVATMTALLLGLVTASAKGSFDAQDVAVRNSSAGILTLDRLLARYGPETQPTRDLLKRTAAARLDEMSSPDRPGLDGLAGPQGKPPGEEIENQILALAPSTDTQRWLKTESLKLTEEVLRARWRVLGSASGSVSRAFLDVVIFWLAMTFGSFGLGAPRNATVITVLIIASISVAAAVFLIFELDGPFDGLIRVSSEPLRHAVANLGR